MEFLSSFGAERIDIAQITDHTGQGKDKMRILFEIQDQERACALYEMIAINRHCHLPDTDQKMQIYFLLDEQTFEQYADEAA